LRHGTAVSGNTEGTNSSRTIEEVNRRPATSNNRKGVLEKKREKAAQEARYMVTDRPQEGFLAYEEKGKGG